MTNWPTLPALEEHSEDSQVKWTDTVRGGCLATKEKLLLWSQCVEPLGNQADT